MQAEREDKYCEGQNYLNELESWSTISRINSLNRSGKSRLKKSELRYTETKQGMTICQLYSIGNPELMLDSKINVR